MPNHATRDRWCRSVPWKRTAFVICLACHSVLPAEETRYHTFADSTGISEAIGVSGKGHVVGTREVRTPQNILRRTPYLYRDNRLFEIPVLEGYTNIEVTGVADPGLVFGYATCVPGERTVNPCGLLWDSYSGKMLPMLPPADGSGVNLMDTTPDCATLVGYVIGNSPPRLQPCLWTRNAQGEFQAQILPTPQRYNPFLQTARVVVSPDGKLVAASVLSEDDKEPSYHTYQWQLTEAGVWSRSRRLDEALHVTDIDNAGLLVGNVQRGQQWLGAVSRPGEANLRVLPLPEGYTESRAVGVGPNGTVVGTCEGHERGPTGWIWSGEETTMIDLPVPFYWLVVSAVNSHGTIVGYYSPGAADPMDKADYDRTVSFSARWPLPSP